MKSSPLISVVMPVYNAEQYVASAVKSILSQSFPDFELVIVNDGSTDKSWDIVRSFNDNRMRLVSNPKNMGNYPSRNKGMKMASGKYICVMDADDISLPERLSVQFSFMENNPDIGLSGTAYSTMDHFKPIYKEPDYENIRIILLRHCHLHHPTWIIRHDYIKRYQLYYNESFKYAADYVLQTKAASLFPISICNEVLLYYRMHKSQISSANASEQGKLADINRIQQLSLLGIEPTTEEEKLHLNFIKGRIVTIAGPDKVSRWAEKLVKANHKMQYFNHSKFQDLVQLQLDKQIISNKIW